MQILRGPVSGSLLASSRRDQSVRGGAPVLAFSPLHTAAAGVGRDDESSSSSRNAASALDVQELLQRVAADRAHNVPSPGASQTAVLTSLDSMAPRLVALRAAQASTAGAALAASQRISERALGWRQTVSAAGGALGVHPSPRLAAASALRAGSGAGLDAAAAATTANPLVERAMRQLEQGGRGAATSTRHGGLAHPIRRDGSR